ncbi:MAG: hypothetical protein NZ942_02230 [Candidatus Aenigmarchaeota archaeon]|nr:hypothetical protein [Candidatus Aenigmarchaeota archaeon]
MGVLEVINLIVYFLVAILFSLATVYARKFLKNMEENEKLAASLIFLNPKVPKCFWILGIVLFVFSISFLLLPFYEFYFKSSLILMIISTYLVLFAFVYFFKVLYEVTKSEEYGA